MVETDDRGPDEAAPAPAASQPSASGQPDPGPAKVESTGCCGRKKKEQEDEGPKSKRPKDRQVTQQTLPACKPVYTRPIVTLIYVGIALIYLPLGIVFIVYGLAPEELSMRYDDSCLANLPTNEDRQNYLWANAGDNAALACNISLTVENRMEPPIYIYYQIRGMYQNFRRYVRSHLDMQLADTGDWLSSVASDTSAQSCVPRIYYQDNDSQLINPCGLVAWSFFNDTYDMTLIPAQTGTPTPIPVREDGIAFASDVRRRFANYTPEFFNPTINDERGGDNITTTVKEDQRFMTWMRLSHTENFRKFWGIIDGVTLQPGDLINITVINQYNTYPFDGEKHLVLSTTSWLGGRGVVLGAAYLLVGGLALIFCLVFLIITVVWPRPFADTSRLLKAPPAGHPPVV